MQLDRRLGPFRLRAWLLAVNFACNALALFGLSRVLASEPGWAPLVLGAAGTLACLTLLSRPDPGLRETRCDE